MRVSAPASSVAAFLMITDYLAKFFYQLAGWSGKLTLRIQTQVLIIFRQGPLLLINFQQDVTGQQVGLRKVRFQLQRVSDGWTSLGYILLVPVKTREREITIPGFVVKFQSGQ